MSRHAVQLTPEQLAKQEARRLKKLEKVQLNKTTHTLLSQAEDERADILVRPWNITGAESHLSGCQRTTVKTWNLLAQTLVRRSLFPTSDCLKAGQREHMLYRELLHPRADILCLQEVDRLDKILPFIDEAGYAHVFASGPRKKHGCLIAFDRKKYELASEQVVYYDEEDVRESNDGQARRGCTHKTKNIGLIVAVTVKGEASRGFLLATTHLFWHPAYTYERARQAGILLRAVSRLRSQFGKDWPAIFAGDFNFAPDDPAYALLVGAHLLPSQSGMFARSRVVHASLDPTVPITTRKMIGERAPTDAEDDKEATSGGSAAPVAEDDEDESADPDRAITNARAAIPADGLLSTLELSAFFQAAGAPVRSAYDDAQRRAQESRICGPRLNLPPGRLGYYEPEWTSYTHYWKTVLDYIFMLDSHDTAGQVVGYSRPPTTQDLEPGIPMKGVCSSDHTSMCAEIQWVPRAQIEDP